jgi:hypothetical protein
LETKIITKFQGFGHLNFENLNLFRILIFDFKTEGCVLL